MRVINYFSIKNPSFAEVQYSVVTVQRTSGGWSVSGYSITKPYFEILQSTIAGTLATITVNGNTVRIQKLLLKM